MNEYKQKVIEMLKPILEEYGEAYLWSKEGWKPEHKEKLPLAHKNVTKFIFEALEGYRKVILLTLPPIKEERDYSSFEEYEKETERRRILQEVHNKIATL